ncbi:hypothetical protein J7E50_10920 [Pedobacter sp. ISL-68]|uniref:hypothetical protein n=1 Tax=unclassified Pedobacter TaxID=2628915 RepID=UPI001BE6C21F|nr:MULTISPECIES: hypothetical protein [unclassified Pedobacter]MBT2561344.1 hypothetical protein [Pedobacter sp. ISL-64]MBT2590733.1 hypothetical protein [Pedobacter sp. ISL-68]
MESIGYAKQYMDSRSSALDKYLDKSDKIQQRLLKRLMRKEEKILKRLAAKDSALYKQYLNQGISYDSIATLSKDSTYQQQHISKAGIIDSLKGVQSFIQKQSAKLNTLTGVAGKAGIESKELTELQQKLNTQQHIDALIGQRTSALESLTGKAGISGLQDIQKKVYYAKEKIKAWKELADEPDEAETAALEYLQGTEGFGESLTSNNSGAFGGLGNNATAENLQRLGFQTKSQVNGLLQQKFGSSLGSVQQQMADQVKDYSEKLKGITDKVKEAKDGINNAKQTLNEAKQAKNKLKNIEKPTFKKNPERGKPFLKRLEPVYNFQTTRDTPDGLRPAMLELGAGVAFKHSPKLSYGIGIALSTGLGQNWQNIKLTYEGVSARAFADWKLIYGFSAQAGYERIFRPANRPYLPETQNQSTNPSNPDAHNNILKESFGGQQQAAYIGIMKRYRINSNWSGTFLAGYNFLWQQEELRSPFVLRFGWGR